MTTQNALIIKFVLYVSFLTDKIKDAFFIRIKTQKDSNLDVTCQNPLYKQCPQLREKNRNSQQSFKKKTLKHHAQQLKGLFSLFSSLLHKNFDHKLKYNTWLWFTFLLLAKVGEGRTLKNESSLPCVDPWRAFKSFFVPDRILSSLRMTKIKNYFWKQVHLIRRNYKDCIKKFVWKYNK